MKIQRLSLVHVLLFLYLVMKPFYFFESGNPQIADFIMLLLLIVTVLSQTFSMAKNHTAYIITGMIFVYYILMVNGVWSILLGGELEVFKSSLWYGYNFAVAVAVLLFLQKQTLKNMAFVYYSVCCSVCLQLIVLLGNLAPVNDELRQVLFFNNPNQLGYYGLLCLAIILYIPQSIKVKQLPFMFALISSLTIIAASLSKAAIVSSILMYLYFLFLSRRKGESVLWGNVLLVTLSVLCLVFIHLYTHDNPVVASAAYENVKERIVEIGSDDDDSLAGRGYDRIVNDAHYLVFGAGEGDYSRFDSVLKLELHSTVANIFFSYGVIGTLLFVTFIFVAIHKHRFFELYPLFCLFLFGLTHNGIRETFLWIFFSLIVSASSDLQANKRAKATGGIHSWRNEG